MYDSSRRALEWNDDGGTDTNFRIEREVAAGSYYVRVRGFANRTTGAYELRVTGGDDHCDTFSCATPIAVPSTTSGRLERNGDYDYFRLEVRTATRLTLETTGSTDTVGRLYDSNRQALETNDDGGTDTNFRIVRQVAAGTYYVRVRGYRNERTGAYELLVAASSPPGDFGLDPLNSAPAGITYAGSSFYVLQGGNDNKVFAYDEGGNRLASAEFDLAVTLRGYSGLAYANGHFFAVPTLDDFVRVYDRNGTPVPSRDFDASSAFAARGIIYAQGHFYIVGFYNKVYVYDSNGNRERSAEFNLADENVNAYGITYAAGRLYVVDDNKVFAYDRAGNHIPSADFDLHPDNSDSSGITYAWGRFYVVDWNDDKVFAYDSTVLPRTGDFVLDPLNSTPTGIAYVGSSFHVLDWSDARVYGYDESGNRLPSADFVLPIDNYRGIASAGSRFYVVAANRDKVYALDRSGNRVPSADFDLNLDSPLRVDSADPQGITYAEGRLFVLAISGETVRPRVHAYDAAGNRMPAADFDLAPGNINARGITYGAGRFYVVSAPDHTVFVYDRAGNHVPSADFELDPGNAYSGGVAYVQGRLYAVEGHRSLRVFAYDVRGRRIP